jgi:hypothetical protein
MVTTRSAIQETKTYTLRNIDAKPKTLIVEHPVRPGYTLLNQKPVETTSSAYRFEVKLNPDSTEKFAVSEERLYDQTTAATNMTPDFLGTFVQNKALPEAGRRQLQQIADLKRQLAEADSQIRDTSAQVDEIIKDQDRIRQNIASLNNVSGQQDQVQKYSRQLSDQETRLAGLRDHLNELRKNKSALEKNVSAAIEKLSF